MTPLMPLGSMFRDFSAGSELAPQSRRRSRPAASMRKQVLSRPPEPKASPEPTIVSFMLCRSAARRPARASAARYGVYLNF